MAPAHATCAGRRSGPTASSPPAVRTALDGDDSECLVPASAHRSAAHSARPAARATRRTADRRLNVMPTRSAGRGGTPPTRSARLPNRGGCQTSPMTGPPARLRTVVLDCPEPRALAEFYRGLLGGDITDDG